MTLSAVAQRWAGSRDLPAHHLGVRGKRDRLSDLEAGTLGEVSGGGLKLTAPFASAADLAETTSPPSASAAAARLRGRAPVARGVQNDDGDDQAPGGRRGGRRGARRLRAPGRPGCRGRRGRRDQPQPGGRRAAGGRLDPQGERRAVLHDRGRAARGRHRARAH
eukprot:667873-Prymnesium_polylepis.1